MMTPFTNMTPAERATYIAAKARDLVEIAEILGVSLRIDRVPMPPLAMGNAVHVVEAWPARQPAAEVVVEGGNRVGKATAVRTGQAFVDEYLNKFEPRRELSDREWAAQPANQREGCTVHVPGVGDL
jgi:hypothetical protein